MAVFTLKSDKQFIRSVKGSPDVHVFEYKDDPNAFDMIRASDSRWHSIAQVGTSRQARFKALEVFGVEIGGTQLTDLINDLTLAVADPNQQTTTFHLVVNRQGLCFVYVNSPSLMRLRVNDYFGWSKYGVGPRVISVKW